MDDHEIVEMRHPAASCRRGPRRDASACSTGTEESGIGRRPLIRNSLLGALGVLGAPAVVLLRDLGPLPGDEPASTPSGSHGMRVVRDVVGTPIRPGDLEIGDLVNAEPESIFEVDEDGEPLLEGVELQIAKSKAAVILVRMEPDDNMPAAAARTGRVDGILCYSKICTHVGCPISLNERNTHHLLCPCHQSTFDLADGAKVVFGPAARALPQLPLMVDDEGYLVAQSDFTEPVGPELLGARLPVSTSESTYHEDRHQQAATTNSTAAPQRSPAASAPPPSWADDRLGLATLAKKNLRKVFPDHWSFMLGEIALWSFVVLLLTGVFLRSGSTRAWARSTYEGSYDQLRGVEMSEAFASTLRHLLRRPRRPADAADPPLGGDALHRRDDGPPAAGLLHRRAPQAARAQLGDRRAAAAARHARGVHRLLAARRPALRHRHPRRRRLHEVAARSSAPTCRSSSSAASSPATTIIPRLYIVHVLLIPGLLLALITAHMLLLVYHKHTQWPGPGRTEQNVVGFPMLPVYAAKAGGFFFIVFGVTALMGGLLSINPVWKFGPYDPSKVTAGSQPDWYMGWPDGALRIMPDWETAHLRSHTLSWNVLLPIIVLPDADVHDPAAAAVHRGVDHRRQARPPPAPAAAQRPDPHRHDGGPDDVLRPALGGRRQRHHRHPSCTCRSTRSRTSCGCGVHRPGDRVHDHPPLVHLAAAQGQRRTCCTATRPASSCARPRAATPSGTCRSSRARLHAHRPRPRPEVSRARVRGRTPTAWSRAAASRPGSTSVRARLSDV